MFNMRTKTKAPSPRLGSTRANVEHLAGLSPDQIIERMQQDAKRSTREFRIRVMQDRFARMNPLED